MLLSLVWRSASAYSPWWTPSVLLSLRVAMARTSSQAAPLIRGRTDNETLWKSAYCFGRGPHRVIAVVKH